MNSFVPGFPPNALKACEDASTKNVRMAPPGVPLLPCDATHQGTAVQADADLRGGAAVVLAIPDPCQDLLSRSEGPLRVQGIVCRHTADEEVPVSDGPDPRAAVGLDDAVECGELHAAGRVHDLREGDGHRHACPSNDDGSPLLSLDRSRLEVWRRNPAPFSRAGCSSAAALL